VPLYDYRCNLCDTIQEVLLPMEHSVPNCCDSPMRRVMSGGYKINIKYPLWVDRMEDIHKAQEQKGERLRMIHPKEACTLR